jgi:hypothetical protein
MSETNGEPVYDLTLKEEVVKVKTKDGNIVHYTIRELPGGERDKFMNGMNKRIEMNPDGTPKGVRDHSEIMADLLFRCVFDEENNRIPISVVQTWPATLQEQWFRKAVALSGLNQKAEEVKND